MGAEQSSSMQNTVNSSPIPNCSGCKNLGNKNTDTVSVDASKIQELSRPGAAGKENRGPEVKPPLGVAPEAEAERKRQEEEALRKRRLVAAEEEAKAKAKANALRAKEEEAARARIRETEEQRRQQAEEQERIKRRQMQEEEEQNRQMQEEEERLRRQEEEEKEARRRQEEEEESRRRQKAEEEERAAKKERLGLFLQKTGFQSFSDKKVKKGILSSGFSYPLHAAVEAKDAEAVELLLWAGADPSLANSKNQTPLAFAQKKNKQGSHSQVIAALAA